MPTRDRLCTADLIQVDHLGRTTNTSVPRALGYKQSISALNNVGKFVPGVLRLNPVILEKVTAFGSPGSSSGDVYEIYKGSYNGHPCAHILVNAGLGPASGYEALVPWDSTLAGHSLQKAYAAMNEADLDVGVMLGELRETLAGLAKPLTALRKYAKLANKLSRRGRRPKGSDTLDMLTGTWLEWRYGIMPLILSIQDIIEHVRSEALAMQGKLLRKGGKTRVESQEKFSATAYPGQYRLWGDVECDIKTQYTSKVFYSLTRPLSWQETLGMDFASLPGIAWELATLSFVWDWFFSVGSWLGSLKTNDARKVLGSCTSQKSTVVATVHVTKNLFRAQVPARGSNGSLQVTYERLVRRINQPLPLGPVVNKEALSLKRQIDSLSLIWQLMPKIRR